MSKDKDTLEVSWTIDWGENGEPTHYSTELHYDKWGNIIKEDE